MFFSFFFFSVDWKFLADKFLPPRRTIIKERNSKNVRPRYRKNFITPAARRTSWGGSRAINKARERCRWSREEDNRDFREFVGNERIARSKSSSTYSNCLSPPSPMDQYLNEHLKLQQQRQSFPLQLFFPFSFRKNLLDLWRELCLLENRSWIHFVSSSTVYIFQSIHANRKHFTSRGKGTSLYSLVVFAILRIHLEVP